MNKCTHKVQSEQNEVQSEQMTILTERETANLPVAAAAKGCRALRGGSAGLPAEWLRAASLSNATTLPCDKSLTFSGAFLYNKEYKKQTKTNP